MGLLRSPDGQIVNLPDEQVGDAVASGYEQISLGQAAEATTAAPVNDTGAIGAIGAGASSLLSGATLGLSDIGFKSLLTEGGAKQLAADREAHPWISGAGQLVGTIAPTLLSGGAATPAGYLSAVTARAAEGGLVEGIGAAGFEGAVQNAGAYLADSALGDRDTTAEGMIGALGTGFAFGAGGALAAHGVHSGSIAARRMFSRELDGGGAAAQEAAQAWQSTSKEVLDSHDQAAEIARAKLSEARTARERAGVTRDQAAAGVFDAKLGTPDPNRAEAVALDQALGKIDGQEAADAARAEAEAAAVVPGSAGVPQGLADFAARAAGIEPKPTLAPEAAHDLAIKVDEYTAARREFDAVRAQVDPDLEKALLGLEAPSTTQGPEAEGVGIRSDLVPRDEFGEPGKGGFKTQGELGRLAADRGIGEPRLADGSADATRAGRPGMAKGTPVGPSPEVDTAELDRLNRARLEGARLSDLDASRDDRLAVLDRAGKASQEHARLSSAAGVIDRNVLETIPLWQLSHEVDAAFAAADQGFESAIPLAKRQERATEIDAIFRRRHRVENSLHDLESTDELTSRYSQSVDDLLSMGQSDPRYDSLSDHVDRLGAAIKVRRALEDAGGDGKVVAVPGLGLGPEHGIVLTKSEGGTFKDAGGSTWRVSQKGVREGGNARLFVDHTENRITRILGGDAPDTRLGIIDGLPHLLERVEPVRSAEVSTNPLLKAWARDVAEQHASPSLSSEPGPAVQRVLSAASEADAKRYISELSTAYNNNKDGLDKVIDESGLSAEQADLIKSRLHKQIKWLAASGGSLAALTAGAAVASAQGVASAASSSDQTSYDIKRHGRPTDGKFEIVGSDGSRSIVDKSDMDDWLNGHLPDGFTGGGLVNPRVPFSVKAGIPAVGEISRDAVYIVRPSELAERGIFGNELHPEHTESIASARAEGKRLPPLTVDVTPEGKLYVEDGNHRLDFAARGNDPVAIKFRDVSGDWEPQTNARDISGRIKDQLPRQLRPVVEERPVFAGAAETVKPAIFRDEIGLSPPAEETELEKLLKSTKDGLDSGKSLGQLSAESPARQEYVSDKAGLRERQAREFRARAAGEAPRAGEFPRLVEPESDLESRLRGTRDALSRGASMRDLAAHPLDFKRLEIAHDAALDRAAAATEPAARKEAIAEARSIEQQLTAVGARPGAVEDVAAMAKATTRLERAAADMVEALGPDAPPTAQKAAAGFRAAEDEAERKSIARTARAADAQADSQSAAARMPTKAHDRLPRAELTVDPITGEKRLVHPETGELSPPLGDFQDRAPSLSPEERVQAAKDAKLRADADLARAKAKEGEAKIESRAADKKAKEATIAAKARVAAEEKALQLAEAARFGGGEGKSSKLATAAKVFGIASELDVPGVPKVHDIPVIGPVLSAYIKYRTLKAALGRFVGRVPATADSRAAALAAKTKDAIAHAVDRSLGLIERSNAGIRVVAVAGAAKAGDALRRRAFDDGLPDAKKGASVPELAAVRMREVAAAVTSPQLVRQMVRGQMREVIDPDLITAAENHLLAMFKHLNDTAPKGPPPNPFSMKQWTPSPAEAMQWERRLAVAHDPRVAFNALATQSLTPEAADTLRAVYPKLFAAAQQRLIQRVADIKNPVAYRQRLQNSLLFDVPLDASLDPENAVILAQAHGGKPAGPQLPAPGGAAPGGLPPPPVPSVANPTNLSSLYQQTMADRPGAR